MKTKSVDTTILIRIDRETHEKLRVQAFEARMTMKAYVDMLLNEAEKKNENDN